MSFAIPSALAALPVGSPLLVPAIYPSAAFVGNCRFALGDLLPEFQNVIVSHYAATPYIIKSKAELFFAFPVRFAYRDTLAKPSACESPPTTCK
jgi:hypothetical protein